MMIKENTQYINELYKRLKNNIEYSNTKQKIKSVLITSTKAGEGKTTVAANLAISMAKSGKKTLLIDFNLINPNVHNLFNISNEFGIVRTYKTKNGKDIPIVKSSIDNLYILPSGSSTSGSEVYLTDKMISLLEEVKPKYDFVVIDTPDITHYSDVQVISQYVDGCLLVIRAEQTSKEEIKKTKELLERVNVQIIGSVLNRVTHNKEYEACCHEEQKNLKETPIKSKNQIVSNSLIKVKNRGKRMKDTARKVAILIVLCSLMFNQVGSIESEASTVDNPGNVYIFQETGTEKIDIEAIDEIDIEEREEMDIEETDIEKIENESVRSFSLDRNKFDKYQCLFPNFPVQVVQSRIFPVHIVINYNRCNSEDYEVKIIGTDYELKQSGCCSNLKKVGCVGREWRWYPEYSGSFWIVLTNKKSGVEIKRKVYVNSPRGIKNLQLQDLKIDTSDTDNTKVKVKIEDLDCLDKTWLFNRDYRELKNNKGKTLKFTIGEPCVWSKTIKDYGDNNIAKSGGYYYISEKKNRFEFNQGNYSVDASIKRPHSIEYEDIMRKHYKEHELGDIIIEKWVMNIVPEDAKKNDDGSYPKGTKFKFGIEASSDKANESGVTLQYAFLRSAEEGVIIPQEYSSKNTWDWTATKPGKYTIIGRIKQADQRGQYLPNSYEKQYSWQIEIGNGETPDIETQEYILNDKQFYGNENGRTLKNDLTIESHKMYYIKVEDLSNQSNLRYKAYSIHDGYPQSLGSYSKSNIIPFYPKSYGEYKLVVMIKDKDSGSYDTKKEYTIQVEKNKDNWR